MVRDYPKRAQIKWQFHEWSMHVHRIEEGTFQPSDLGGAYLTPLHKADLLARYRAQRKGMEK